MAFCVGDKEFFPYRSEWNSVVSLSHIFFKTLRRDYVRLASNDALGSKC